MVTETYKLGFIACQVVWLIDLLLVFATGSQEIVHDVRDEIAEFVVPLRKKIKDSLTKKRKKEKKNMQAAKSSSHQLLIASLVRKRGPLGRKALSPEKKKAVIEDQEVGSLTVQPEIAGEQPAIQKTSISSEIKR